MGLSLAGPAVRSLSTLPERHFAATLPASGPVWKLLSRRGHSFGGTRGPQSLSFEPYGARGDALAVSLSHRSAPAFHAAPSRGCANRPTRPASRRRRVAHTAAHIVPLFVCTSRGGRPAEGVRSHQCGFRCAQHSSPAPEGIFVRQIPGGRDRSGHVPRGLQVRP
jgi:hypothetical protein